jgi:hypothetical protein
VIEGEVIAGASLQEIAFQAMKATGVVSPDYDHSKDDELVK